MTTALRGLNITVDNNDIVMVMGDLYVKTPEALERVLRELADIGYSVDNLRESGHRAGRATIEQMEKQGWSLWYASIRGYMRRGKCGACGNYISTEGIQSHGHTCEVCSAVTYLEIVDGTTVRFKFLNERYRGQFLAPQLNMKARRWDTEEGFLYLYNEPLGRGGLGVVAGEQAEAYLAENSHLWEIVEEDGEKLLKVRYPHPWNRVEAAIEPYDIWGSQSNYRIVKVWEGVEYSEYDRLPIPESMSIYETWHWGRLPKSPRVHERIMSAVGQVSDKGWYHQDGRTFFQDGIKTEFEKFIEHFTELDATDFSQRWRSFRKDGPGFIDDFARWCHQSAVVENRPNMWNTVNALGKALEGKTLTQGEVEAANLGTYDPTLKQLLYPTFEPTEWDEELEVVEADVENVERKLWYLVKESPSSAEAKRIAGQLVCVVTVESKTDEVTVFTATVLLNKGGVAIRIPRTDLTARR